MTNREKAKHIDAFKYWCESNEENGVITLPKFLCEHIVEILDDTNARPHGEWKPYNKTGIRFQCSVCDGRYANAYHFCPNCGAWMSANDRQVTGKLNSEIEKSKSEIVPDYRDGWRLKEGDAE